MIKVESKVPIYEINGVETKELNTKYIPVSSHWNYRDRIVLEIAGISYTIIASDLHKAIDNAVNSH